MSLRTTTRLRLRLQQPLRTRESLEARRMQKRSCEAEEREQIAIVTVAVAAAAAVRRRWSPRECCFCFGDNEPGELVGPMSVQGADSAVARGSQWPEKIASEFVAAPS